MMLALFIVILGMSSHASDSELLHYLTCEDTFESLTLLGTYTKSCYFSLGLPLSRNVLLRSEDMGLLTEAKRDEYLYPTGDPTDKTELLRSEKREV